MLRSTPVPPASISSCCPTNLAGPVNCEGSDRGMGIVIAVQVKSLKLFSIAGHIPSTMGLQFRAGSHRYGAAGMSRSSGALQKH